MKMKKLFALILCVASLLAVAVFPARAEEAHDIFADVKPGKWYTEAVDWAYKNGFITEISDNVFDPNAPITREAFLVGLTKLNLRMTGTELPHYETMSFSDVEPDKWYSDYIEYAYQNDIVKGIGNGKFGFGLPIKRQDAAVMLKPRILLPAEERTTVDYWGYEKIVDLDKASEYARLPVMLACSVIKITYHSDVDSHDQVNDPLFVGNKDHEFMPHKYLTRAEFCVVIYKQYRNNEYNGWYIG